MFDKSHIKSNTNYTDDLIDKKFNQYSVCRYFFYDTSLYNTSIFRYINSDL